MFLFSFTGIQHYFSNSSIHFLIFIDFHLSLKIKAPPLFSLFPSLPHLPSPPAPLPLPPPVLPLTSLPTVPGLPTGRTLQ